MRLMKFNEYNSTNTSDTTFKNNFKLGPEWWNSWKKKNLDKYNFNYDVNDKTFNVYTKEEPSKHILKYVMDDNSVYTDLDRKMMEGIDNDIE